MEKLVAKQEEVGKEIQRIISNYKKDSQGRKSEKSYYEERLRRLEDAWAMFDATHIEIQNLPNVRTDHPYFKSNYYQGLLDLHSQFRDHFLDQINRLGDSRDHNVLPPSSATQLEGAAGLISQTLQPQMAMEVPSKPPTQNEVNKLIRRQQAVADSLRRLLNTVTFDDCLHPKAYYELSLRTINQYWSQLEEYNLSIWELTDDPTAAGYDMQTYTDLEDRVRKCIVYLSTKVEEHSASSAVATSQLNSSQLKLPKIVLPKFDGNYLKWRQFYDLFTQMVHNQPIPNCQKMWYLKTNLSGEAEKLIRHFPLSEENYISAWKMLQDRYQNPRLLVAALLNKLLLQPTHTSDNVSAAFIKSLHDTTKECLLGLENLGVPTNNWDPLLLHILIKKLDKATHALYEQTLNNPRELQTIKDFLNFLETRFQSLESLGAKNKGLDEQQKRPHSVKSLASVAAPKLPCVVCKEGHQLFACKAFLGLTPHKRLAILHKHNLCMC